MQVPKINLWSLYGVCPGVHLSGGPAFNRDCINPQIYGRRFCLLSGAGGWLEAFVVNMIVGLLFGFLTQISGIFGILSSAYSLAVLVPWWALMFRRLHDIGKPGGWAFLSLT